MKKYLGALTILMLSSATLYPLSLSSRHAQSIGKKIWMNECAGTIQGLTSWNEGEEFASLGIGHFIWCPKGKTCPFSESFPRLISFLKKHNVAMPTWLRNTHPCPWNSRKDFLQSQQSPRMIELRTLLSTTIELQTKFIIERLERALPHMVKGMPEHKKAHIKKQFNRLEQTPQGVYALIDYVNFKGEGLVEKYNGQGWGLLHVLEDMNGNDPKAAVHDFVDSAKKLLTRRVKNAPPKRNEARWLPGWKNRLDTYITYIPT